MILIGSLAVLMVCISLVLLAYFTHRSCSQRQLAAAADINQSCKERQLLPKHSVTCGVGIHEASNEDMVAYSNTTNIKRSIAWFDRLQRYVRSTRIIFYNRLLNLATSPVHNIFEKIRLVLSVKLSVNFFEILIVLSVIF